MQEQQSFNRQWIGSVGILVWCATATVGAACSLTGLPTSSPAPPDELAAECTVPEDCSFTGTTCIMPLCAAGKCDYELLDDYAPTSSQKPGDCQQVVCKDGDPAVVASNDPFDDGNECTIDSCADDVPVHAVQEGKSCNNNDADGLCNSEGDCVECLQDEHCSTDKECALGVCVLPACTDKELSSGETGIDCGGGECPVCPDGDPCGKDEDCESGVCDSESPVDPLECQPAACDDLVKNGAESDTDCGGDECPACAETKLCTKHSDCGSGVCNSESPLELPTCQPDTCFDLVENGEESDIDCGGEECGGCSLGNACKAGDDCKSKVCSSGGICSASCEDEVQNQNEQEIDCGGRNCPACEFEITVGGGLK